MNYVYLIKRIDDDKYYLGSTNDLKRRLFTHNNNGCTTTKGYKWELIYYESYETLELARIREKKLKNNRGSKRALYNRLNIKFK